MQEIKEIDILEIKKSKFWCYAFDVKTAEDVGFYFDALKKLHKKATHIVYAYILSSPHLEKAVDDGEPSGTAGRPILNVLQKRGEKDKVIFVVRYFGGIKLGAGGLVRAYIQSASLSLSSEK